MPENTNSFQVYRSSAGSGKTFALVKTYLKLLFLQDNPHYFRHILAITFTNKATAEMKNRIIEALGAFANQTNLSGRNLSLKSDLINELNISEDFLRQKSKAIFRYLLHYYTDFSVSTIDKFSHRIIRTFANDLHLPLNFEVSLDQDATIFEAVELLISSAGKDDETTEALLNFAFYQMEDDKSWQIDSLLKKFAKEILNESNYDIQQQLKSAKKEDLEKFVAAARKFVETYKATAHQALQLIHKNNLDAYSFYQTKNGFYGFLKKAANGTLDKVNSHALKSLNEDKWLSKTFNPNQLNFEHIKPEIVKAVEYAINSFPIFILFQNHIKNYYSLHLLSNIEKELSAFKKEENILNISDFNQKISAIVLKEPAPFIYERLGERYHHYMIDEFQDTSTLQWQNILPLIDNSLSYQNQNMIVGDTKQAIYRFRGGEVRQFAELPEIFGAENNPIVAERAENINRNFNAVTLNANYRSKKEIVDFNNAFFDFLKNQFHNDFINKIYDAHSQVVKKPAGGDVCIKLLPKEDDNALMNEKYLTTTVNYINECIALGYRQKDIAILCRRAKDGNLVGNYLQQETEIKVISDDSLLLASADAVQLLFSLLSFIENEKNNENAVKLIVLMCKKNLIEARVERALQNFKDNSAWLKNELRKYNIYSNDTHNFSLFDFTEKAARNFHLLDDADAYTQFFLDAVFQFTQRYQNDLSEFIFWWNEKKSKLAIKAPENIDAVRITTIHKAKGLEYPVVIYPFANSYVKNQKNYALASFTAEKEKQLLLLKLKKELEHTDYSQLLENEKNNSLLDLLNLVYVAFTRPTERLCIVSAPPKKKNGEDIYDWLQNFAAKSGLMKILDDETFTYGEKMKIVLNGSENKNAAPALKHFISNDWRGKIKVSYDWQDAWQESEKSTRSYGKLVHLILSEIKYESDIEKVVNKFYLQGRLNETDKAAVEKDIRNMIRAEENKPYFSKELTVKTEAAIMQADGSSYRPDRVVIDKNGKATIIDFKTGSKLSNHQTQIEQYAALLKEMGYNDVKIKVVYLG